MQIIQYGYLLGMYKFLPTELEKIKEPEEIQACFALITKTLDTIDILKW